MMMHARVRDVMTSAVITVAPATPYRDIAASAPRRDRGGLSALLRKARHGRAPAR